MEPEPAPTVQVYSGWSSFAILDEVATPFLVADFSPGKQEIFWANNAALKLHWKTLHGLKEFNRNQEKFSASGLGDADIYKAVQLQSRAHSVVKSISLGRVEIRCRWSCRPCQVDLAEPGSKTLVFVAFEPCPNVIGTDGDVLLSFSGVISTMFEYGPQATKYAVYQNEEARSFYRSWRSLGQEISQHRKRVLCLHHVLDSCLWSSLTQKEELADKLNSLTPEDGEIIISCRKTQGASAESQEEVCHRMCFRCITSPFTLETVLLLNEYDITEEALQCSTGMSTASLERASMIGNILADVTGELLAPVNGIIGEALNGSRLLCALWRFN